MSTILRPLAALLFTCSIAAANWPTFGGDPQRSGWDRDDPEITPQTVQKFGVVWKLKLENEPKELNSLMPPLVWNPVYTNQGASTYVVVAGSSDNVFAIDADSGKLIWQKHFTSSATLPASAQGTGSYFCPNALNDTPTIAWGQGGPNVYVISTDGMLHALSIFHGEDKFAPVPFVPPFSKNWSLNLSGDVLYTSLSQNCAQSKNGVYALDLKSPEKSVTHFEASPFGGGIWGRGGVSIASNGSVLAATGDGPPNPAAGRYADTVLALAPKTLQMVDYYLPPNAAYITRKDLDIGNSTPLIFTYKGRELAVIGGKEGVLDLLDTKSLGGADHTKPLYQTPRLANDAIDIAGHGFWGAFATGEEADGTRWVFAPVWGPIAEKNAAGIATNGAAADGSVMAFKVTDHEGQPQLTPVWVSGNLGVPEPPVYSNGVVFVLSSGEYVRQINENGGVYTSAERMAKNTGHAILHALDAKTGKELYSSGEAIPSFTHLGGIAVSEGKVFVTTHDGMLYAFGAGQ